MLFSENDAKAITWTNVPTSTASTSWTSSPLNMNLNIAVSEASTLHVMAGLSRVSQQADAKNTKYRITIDDIEASQTNVGYDHRGALRRHVAFTAAQPVTPGNHNVAVQVM
jgi:hypothetical protein